MREGGVGEWLAVGADRLAVRALETLDVGLGVGLLALPGEGGGLLLSHTGALGGGL